MAISTCISTIDWSATGSMFQGIGTLGGAVAVYAAAKLGLSSWKKQKVAERNRDEAERILCAAYDVRRALRGIRSPIMLGFELLDAEKGLDEDHSDWRDKTYPEEKQKRMITAQAYYNRAGQVSGERNSLFDCVPMARALFGSDLEVALENLVRQFHIIRTYADAYVDDHNGNDRDFTKAIHKALFDSGQVSSSEPNEISDAINEAIQAIETICIPHIRLEAK